MNPMLDDTNNAHAAIDIDALARVAEDETAAGEIASGFGLSKKNAKLWQTVTQELRDKLGRPVRPEDFVAYSKTKPGKVRIGHLFPSDSDAVLADKFRALLAAHYCRVVRVVIGAGEAPVRTIMRVVDANNASGYVPMQEVTANPDYRKQVLADCARQLRYLKEKFKGLSRWLGSPQIEAALAKIEAAIADFDGSP